MSKNAKIWLSIGAGFLLVLVLSLSYIMAVLNAETGVANRLKQQKEVAKTSYSSGWGELETKYSFTKEQNAFMKDLFLGMTEGRYRNDQNVMFKMITESNQNIDMAVAKDFSITITRVFGARAEIFKSLGETKRQHDTMLNSYPAAIIYQLAGRQPIDVIYVTDSGTKEAFNTGIDDRKLVD